MMSMGLEDRDESLKISPVPRAWRKGWERVQTVPKHALKIGCLTVHFGHNQGEKNAIQAHACVVYRVNRDAAK